MIRSLNTAVLGIKQFQTSLDAIGNNLANINTIGYKGARVDFSDTLAQTLRGPTPDTGLVSGTAGMQLGNGVKVSAIKNQFSQGAIKQTGVRTDIAITGAGFFLVQNSINSELFATRAGDFREDKNSYLVTNDGYRVQGLNKQAPANTVSEKTEIGDIKLNLGSYAEDRTDVSLATDTNTLTKTAHGYGTGDQVKFNGTLPGVTSGTISTSTVYFVAKKTDDTFSLHSTAADAASGANEINFTAASSTEVTVTTADSVSNTIAFSGVSLTTGDAVYLNASTGGLPGGLTDGQKYFVSVAGGNMSFHVSEDDATATPAANIVSITTDGTAGFKLYKDEATVTPLTLSGGASIASYSIGADGKINMLLTDGTQYVRGQIMLQDFQNPQALLKQGSNLFGNLATAGPIGSVEDSSSDSATNILKNAMEPGSSGVGRIASGALEMSNVDMAQEFSNMITTQRAFQSNARMITTSDEILKEMLALKR